MRWLGFVFAVSACNSAVTAPDLAAPVVDLAVLDLSSGSDLAPAPDLAPAADLARPPDLELPPDLFKFPTCPDWSLDIGALGLGFVKVGNFAEMQVTLSVNVGVGTLVAATVGGLNPLDFTASPFDPLPHNMIAPASEPIRVRFAPTMVGNSRAVVDLLIDGKCELHVSVEGMGT
jgi:hypothetical protein